MTLVASGVALAGCGETSRQGRAPAPSPPPPPASEVLLDLDTRRIDIDAGQWTVDFCQGDGPFICVSNGADHVGVVEHGDWTLDDGAAADVLAAGGTDSEALLAHADDVLATFREDRPRGCGNGYQVIGEDPTVVTVAGKDGLRYGFSGVVDGRTVERVIIHAVIDGETLSTFTAAAYEPDGCLAGEGEFLVPDLDSFTPTLARLVAAARLPDRHATSTPG